MTEKQIKRFLHYTGTQIKKNKLTNGYFWASYGKSPIPKKAFYTSDMKEYKTRKQAIKAFITSVLGPE